MNPEGGYSRLSYRTPEQERRDARRVKRHNAIKATWGWIVAIVTVVVAAMVAYGLVTGGRSLITDVETVVRAVAESNTPVEEEALPSASDSGFPMCVAEDAPNYPCYWDANTMGNGQGRSFVRDVTGTFVYGWDE